MSLLAKSISIWVLSLWTGHQLLQHWSNRKTVHWILWYKICATQSWKDLQQISCLGLLQIVVKGVTIKNTGSSMSTLILKLRQRLESLIIVKNLVTWLWLAKLLNVIPPKSNSFGARNWLNLMCQPFQLWMEGFFLVFKYDNDEINWVALEVTKACQPSNFKLSLDLNCTASMSLPLNENSNIVRSTCWWVLVSRLVGYQIWCVGHWEIWNPETEFTKDHAYCYQDTIKANIKESWGKC